MLLQLTCIVSQSFPTGDNNLALLEAFGGYQSMSGAGIRAGFSQASQGTKGYTHHTRKHPFGRGARAQQIYQQKNRGSASSGNGKRKNKATNEKSSKKDQSRDPATGAAQYSEGEVDSEAPSSDEENSSPQPDDQTAGAVGEAGRKKIVRFADPRDSQQAQIDNSGPTQGQG